MDELRFQVRRDIMLVMHLVCQRRVAEWACLTCSLRGRQRHSLTFAILAWRSELVVLC